MSEDITAQHEETGRIWTGPREQLPPRYSVVPAVTAPAETVAERIGLLADRCDNLHAASQLPLPAGQHLPILRVSLLELRDELRAMHIEITGDDPWSD